MRVLHVIVSLDPAAGGPPAVAIRLAAALAGLGHDVTLASYASPELASRVREGLSAVPHADRVRLEFIPPAVGIDRLTASRAVPRLRKLIEVSDVVHLHGVWDPILRAAASATRDARVPYVLAPHGMLDPWSLRQRRWKKRLALLLGYGEMLRGAAFIHTLNADEARLLEPAEFAIKAKTLPNGVFLEEVAPLPPPGAFRASRPELGGSAYVLFLSRLHYKKGLDYLADAFALIATEFPDLRLVIAGPDGGEEGPFRQRVQNHRLQNRVHVVGPLYGRDKLAALADATCFCLPSRQEGFSMAITEALACGIPVVISENCHFPEVAEVGAGEVVPLDAGKLAAGLRRVLSDSGRRQRMGEAGRALVAERFTWPKIAEQSIAAYQAATPPRS